MIPQQHFNPFLPTPSIPLTGSLHLVGGKDWPMMWPLWLAVPPMTARSLCWECAISALLEQKPRTHICGMWPVKSILIDAIHIGYVGSNRLRLGMINCSRKGCWASWRDLWSRTADTILLPVHCDNVFFHYVQRVLLRLAIDRSKFGRFSWHWLNFYPCVAISAWQKLIVWLTSVEGTLWKTFVDQLLVSVF